MAITLMLRIKGNKDKEALKRELVVMQLVLLLRKIQLS